MKKIVSLALCIAVMALNICAFADYGDVEESPANDEIMFLDELGIIKGYADGNFYPDNYVTNAEFAVMLCRILKLETAAPSQSAYKDVPQTHWALGYINAPYDKGIGEEYSDIVVAEEDENGNMIAIEKLLRV